MKKFSVALLVVAFAATAASAGVGIAWQAQWGGYDHTVTPPLTGGSGAILDTYAVTWQLLYAGVDNVANPVDVLNVAGGWVSGDDAVWATRTIAIGGGTSPEDGATWDQWMRNTGGGVVYEDLAWATAGSSFQRVFEGAPVALAYYFESPLLALDTGYTGSPAQPQLSFLDAVDSGFQPDQQIPSAIPEPATMALLGLGALTMAIRRRRS